MAPMTAADTPAAARKPARASPEPGAGGGVIVGVSEMVGVAVIVGEMDGVAETVGMDPSTQA